MTFHRTPTGKRRQGNRLLFLLAITVTLAMAVSLVLLLRDNNEAEGELRQEELDAKVLMEVKEQIPEAQGVKVAQRYSDYRQGKEMVEYNVQDAEGDLVAVVLADQSSGEVTYLFNAAIDPVSGDVKMGMEEAKARATEFLRQKGVDFNGLEIDRAELRRAGMTGPPDPDKQTPVYRYEIDFKTYYNGAPLDSGLICSVWINPDSGEIILYSICPPLVDLENVAAEGVLIEKEEAVEIAKAYCQEAARDYAGQFDDPSLSFSIKLERNEVGELARLHYMRDETGVIKPYWHIVVTTELSNGAFETVGLDVDAVTGAVEVTEGYE